MGKKVITYFHERKANGEFKLDAEGNQILTKNGGHKPAKQTYKDECDINSVMQSFQTTGAISHLARHGAQYGDVSNFDYEDAMNRIAEANSMFYDLPSEIRVNEFKNKPQAFIDFVSTHTPEQVAEKLPMLAAPGRQFPDVIGGRIPPAEAALQPSRPAEPATPADPSPPDPAPEGA